MALVRTESLHLFVCVESLGWAQVLRRGFLEDLLSYRSPCDTFLGDSLACNASILTGATPAQHGHFARFVFDPDHSPFGWANYFDWIPEPFASSSLFRGRLSRLVAARGKFSGDFQLNRFPFAELPSFDCAEKRDIYRTGGINGGQRTIFESWEDTGVPWFRSERTMSDAENVAALRDEIERGEIQLAWLFFGSVDSVMHGSTTSSPETDAVFDTLEATLRGLHSLAQSRYRDVHIHLFGNHGMTDTRGLSTMMTDFHGAGFEFPRDYAAVWDMTMVRFWFPGGDAIREHICDWLRGRPEGRILKTEELANWGCDFPHRRYGDVIFLLESGTLFAPSYVSRSGLRAMHDFDPTDPDSRACWLTTHLCERPPGRIDEIHRVMLSSAMSLANRPAAH
jgi:hypothetical protein